MAVDLLTGLLYVAMLGVVIVLGFGIFTLYRSGDEARSRSNKLMRLRIVLQFTAILLIVVIYFAKEHWPG